MKQSTASINKIILLCLLSLILLILGYSLAQASEKNLDDTAVIRNTTKQAQLGFYDLLSEKQEIYNIDITPMYGHGYIASLTMSTDPHFLLKGKILLTQDNRSSYFYFNFIPFHYQNPENNRMIHSLVDYTTYNNILIHDFKVKSSQLIVSRLGILILIPEVLSLPK